MATRRGFLILIRSGFALSTTLSVHSPLQTIHQFHTFAFCDSLLFKTPLFTSFPRFPSSILSSCDTQYSCFRNFASDRQSKDFDYLDSEGIYDDVDDDEEEDGAYEEEEDIRPSKAERFLASKENIERLSEHIGYKNLGRLNIAENPFKTYEPYFAVVKVGPHQFKVSNGDVLFTEKLIYCDVLDKLKLTKVLMLGSKNQTIIGRPLLPDAAVYAVVEEHMKEKKVIIFKKRRRKHYRRTTGHRQRLTRLRILNVEGIEKTTKSKPLPRILDKLLALKQKRLATIPSK